MEARKLSDSIQKKADGEDTVVENIDSVVQALDAMGYDEAAQYVYGMMYPEWKKRHAQKASDEQMEKFQTSKPLWAAHDKQVLEKRREDTPDELPNSAACVLNRSNGATSTSTSTATPNTNTKASLLSNVCCEDIDNIDNTQSKNSAEQRVPSKLQIATAIENFVPPALPSISFSLGVVTISDRAFSGDYPTGDLSGPAVKEVVQSILDSSSNTNTTTNSVETTIVPDDIDAIQTTLINWSSSTSSPPVDLILTTGGTGFSPRDVTPEATEAVLERPCDGLMAFCTSVLKTVQPLAALSRGTAGVRGNTLIANLPGNPYAVREILPVLLPLALQAVADMKQAD